MAISNCHVNVLEGEGVFVGKDREIDAAGAGIFFIVGVFVAVHLVFGTVRKSYIHPSIYTNESCLFVFDWIWRCYNPWLEM